MISSVVNVVLYINLNDNIFFINLVCVYVYLYKMYMRSLAAVGLVDG